MKKTALLSIPILSSSLYSSEQSRELLFDDSTLVTMAIILFIISFGTLAVALIKLRKAKSMHEDILQKQQDMEVRQTGILTNMSENISKITKEAIENRKNILKNSNNKSLEYILSEVIETENQLLDKTNDLIGFLKLKSKKVKINNEFFNLNNVLNEVSGSISSIFKGSDIELIFDIDNDIPRYLIGDSLHLGQILHNMLEFSITQTLQGEVKLAVSMFKTFEEKTELQFRITDTGVGIQEDKIDTIFEPRYNEETEEYSGLGNFVANELVGLMHGELLVESSVGKGSTYTIILPLQVSDPANRRRYRLPEKILTTKKVFIVDSSYNSALAIKKMFAYFKHDVRVLSKWEFLKQMPCMVEYDIVILDHALFNVEVIEYLTEIKRGRDVKIISVASLLKDTKNIFAIVDSSIKKPLNQERVFELIIDLYKLNVKDRKPDDMEEENEEFAKTYRGNIEERKGITKEDFSYFSGNKILIVEDNLINQKVLTTVLNSSGIDISLANNGEEAVMEITRGKKTFDLVLMDINMPVMDGYTATKQIRDTGAFNDLPIVAFTALVLESEVHKMFNLGINAFLEKPLNIGKLYTIFDLYLQPMTNQENSIKVEPDDSAFIDGINIEEGIKHSNGNEALYMELLSEFYNTYGESSDLFERLLEEHRYEQIKMLCLDMKGLAGTIGAEDMYNKVDEIYKLFIYNNQSLLANYTNEYQDEMDRLNKSIKNYLKSNQYS